jgi:hypothetical protein
VSAGRNKNSKTRLRKCQRAKAAERKRQRQKHRAKLRGHNVRVARWWKAYFIKLYGTARLI